MTVFEELVRTSLGELTIEAKRKVIAELYQLGNEFVIPKVADTASRVFVKSLDGVVGASVRALEMEEDAARLSAAYLAEVTEQLSQFSAALDAYLPHALAVEVNKKRFGTKSAQANAARKVREEWMNGVRSEVRDVFKAVAGSEVVD